MDKPKKQPENPVRSAVIGVVAATADAVAKPPAEPEAAKPSPRHWWQRKGGSR